MDDPWLYYEVFTSVTRADEPHPRGLSAEGLSRIVTLERAIAGFYAAHRARINGIYIFHYWDESDGYRGPAAEDTIRLAAGMQVEFIRLRFRVAAADGAWARQSMRDLLGGDAMKGVVLGWRLVDGYTARADVGARFGDLAHGVDPTEPVVKILTGATEMRFYLLDHPDFTPNHDIIHLYFNALGLFYPEEVAALEARAEKVKGFMRKHEEERGARQ